MVDPSKRLSLAAALGWIALSTLLVSGSAAAAWVYSHYLEESRRSDSAFYLTTLVQTGPEREALKSLYLAEQLNLSIDEPTNIYGFDLQEARDRLLASPVIKEATVKSFNPGTVYIDYTIRKPIAYVGDYTNTAIDEEGYLFPAEPFYTPKRLPEIYFGLPKQLDADQLWGKQVTSPEHQKALEVMTAVNRILGTATSRIVKLDVSQAFADSYGKRQIILVIEEKITHEVASRPTLLLLPRILRLHSTRYEEALRDYTILRDDLQRHLPSGDFSETQVVRYPVVVVDLRIPNLAYIQ